MAVEREEIILELRAETAIAEQNVLKFRKKLSDQAAAATNAAGQTSKAFQRINQTSKQLSIAEKHLDTLNAKLAQSEGMSKRAGRGANFFGQQLGYFISDVRFGPMAVGNNLSIMAVAFQQVQREAKQAGETVSKALVRSLRGPTGVLIAMQVVIALLPEIIEFFRKITGGAKEASKALNELENATNTLAKQIEAENEVLKEKIDNQRHSIFMAQDELKILNTLSENTAEFLVRQGILAEKTDILNLSRREQLRLLDDLLTKEFNLSEAAKRAAEDITEDETSNRVLKILGLTTNVEDLQRKAEISIRKHAARTGQSYAEASEEWWNSSAGRIMSAKIIAAEQKSREDAEKEREAELKKKRAAFAKKRAEELAKIMRESKEIQQLLVDAWTPDTLTAQEMWQKKAKRILEIIKHSIGVEEAKITTSIKPDEINEQLRKGLAPGYLSPDQVKAQKLYAQQVADAKKDAWQDTIGNLANFLQNSAELNEQNKGLARAAIVANSASAAIGIWDSWWNKDKTPIPAPLRIAGTVASSLALITATAQSLKALNSNTPLSGGGAAGGGQSTAPTFEIIGATGTNQLRETIDAQLGRQTEQINKVYVVAAEVDHASQMEREAVNSASLG